MPQSIRTHTLQTTLLDHHRDDNMLDQYFHRYCIQNFDMVFVRLMRRLG